MEKLEHSYTTGGKGWWCSHFRKQFGIELNIWLSYDLGKHAPENWKCSHKNLYLNVHNSIIYSSQKLQTQMSISWWEVRPTWHICTRSRKEMKCWCVLQRWWASKEADHKEPQITEFHSCEMSRTGRFIVTESRVVVVWAGGGVDARSKCQLVGGFFGEWHKCVIQ